MNVIPYPTTLEEEHSYKMMPRTSTDVSMNLHSDLFKIIYMVLSNVLFNVNN